MSNDVLKTSIIAKAAIKVLENELVMGKQVFRGYEDEFDKSVNGYEVGDTISVRRPADFTVRRGATAQVQDVVEGKTTVVVDKQIGVDFKFTSKQLTLDIGTLAERVIRPAMIQLANEMDADLHGLYKYVPNWVGTPGQTVKNFDQFTAAPERMDEYAVPVDSRIGVLSPSDYWSTVGAQTGLYIQDAAKSAYRKGHLGDLGGVDTYRTQNIATHIVGSDVTTVTVNQSITESTIAYDTVKDTMTQTITIAGGTLNPGDVFTIADVNAVNPVTKADLGFAKQFTVISYSSNSLVFWPAMIWDGAHKNVALQNSTTDLNTKALTFMGTASTGYRQNMVFHKNAFALVTVPMIKPPGAVDVARESHNGISARLIPYYDGTNDVANYRLDLLYGVKAIDPRLAVRLSGAALA